MIMVERNETLVMTDLEKTIIAKASGETRLNPDEQRRYLGTFAERVVLSVLLEDSETPPLKEGFEGILDTLLAQYDELTVKISPQLDLLNQMFYLKKATDKGLKASIVDDTQTRSPYGLIIHTNQAENISNPDIKQLYPHLFNATTSEKCNTPTFWQKLFGTKRH